MREKARKRERKREKETKRELKDLAVSIWNTLDFSYLAFLLSHEDNL